MREGQRSIPAPMLTAPSLLLHPTDALLIHHPSSLAQMAAVPLNSTGAPSTLPGTTLPCEFFPGDSMSCGRALPALQRSHVTDFCKAVLLPRQLGEDSGEL